MREIKYKINNEWFDSTTATLSQNGTVMFWNMATQEQCPLDDNYIPVFYTGLKDKNKHLLK